MQVLILWLLLLLVFDTGMPYPLSTRIWIQRVWIQMTISVPVGISVSIPAKSVLVVMVLDWHLTKIMVVRHVSQPTQLMTNIANSQCTGTDDWQHNETATHITITKGKEDPIVWTGTQTMRMGPNDSSRVVWARSKFLFSFSSLFWLLTNFYCIHKF